MDSDNESTYNETDNIEDVDTTFNPIEFFSRKRIMLL